jgi:putative ABC transport system substrate-binding protein
VKCEQLWRKNEQKNRQGRLATVFLTTASCAEPQQPKKVPRIGYLSSGEPARESARAEGIRLALRERGYIEGQNIATEYRYAEGKIDRYPELAAELVRLMDSSFLTMTLSIGRMGQG